MWKYYFKCTFIFIIFGSVFSKQPQNLIELALEQNGISTSNYLFWPNATIPFYVNPEHFDHEQSLAILTGLAMFAFRTCLKFAPVMAPPASNEHVLVFENGGGVRRCLFDTIGHSVFEPHRVILGYECLKSPQIDMVIMRALGFPFEHNRINRGLYIEILEENIEPGSIDLFTKEATMPIELRSIPYDINSVMHFGPRDFSKNGHRTILFKDHNLQQYRLGLTKLDVRKIETIYGPECRARDRKEKLELCQSYPGVARKKRNTNLDDNPKLVQAYRPKRDIEVSIDVSSLGHDNDRNKKDAEVVTKSLRVNPDITPPPSIVKETLAELGIVDAVQEIVDQVHKVSALALKNARAKYCNNTKPDLRSADVKDRENTDVLGIIEVIAHFAQSMVDNAVANLTKFCEESESIEVYQRARCGWNDGSDRCRQTYRSTKSGAVKYSTQHRPVYVQSTNHKMVGYKKNIYARSGNDTEDITTEAVKSRRKRDVVHEKAEVAMEETDKNVNLENHDLKGLENADKRDDKPSSDVKTDNKYVNKDNKEVKADIKTENAKKIVNKTEHFENKEKNAENKDENVKNDDELILRSATAIPVKAMGRFEPVRRQGRSHRVRYTKDEEDADRSSMSIETERPKKKHHREPEESERTAKKMHHREPEDSLRPTMKKHHIEPEDIEEVQKYKEENSKEEYEKEDNWRPVENKKRKHKENTEEDDWSTKQKKWGDNGNNDRKKKHRELEDRRKPKQMKRKEKESGRNYKEDDDKEEYATERQNKKPQDVYRNDEMLPQTVKLSKANEEFYNDRKWPGGNVRYVIMQDTNYDIEDLRRRLQEVTDILKRKTCVRIKEMTEDQATNHQDYIVINASPDYVTGRVGGKQSFGSVELFRGGQHRQHAAMMVMAMLGFYFELSRHDRDKYVRVHMRHVRPDKLHHFEKIRKDATLPLPYDYKSATQPAWQYWRQLGRTGISTVATYKQQDPDGSVMKSMGQNSQLLSDIDIVKINSVYGDKCLRQSRSKLKANKANKEKLHFDEQNEEMTVDKVEKK